MTHETMPLILMALAMPLAIYLGWTGFRTTLHAPADSATEGTD